MEYWSGWNASRVATTDDKREQTPMRVDLFDKYGRKRNNSIIII